MLLLGRGARGFEKGGEEKGLYGTVEGIRNEQGSNERRES